MFAARGPARVRGKTRATRATLALIITLTAGAVAASGTAAASPIAAKRAEAQQVETQIQQAQSSLERQIEAYNKVHDDYAATKTKLRRSRELLGVAKANLGRAQKNLAASLTQAYKNGGNDDLAYLLASSSFSDLVDNVSVLEKASNASGQLLTTIVKYKKEVSTQEATLQTETAKLHQELGEMAQRKHAIESQISSLHTREAQISSDIKRLIDEEQRRQDAAASAAAAAATGGGTSSSSSSSSTGGDIPIPPSGTLGGQAVAIAMQYLGTPYVWGGASPGGFDCSGLTMYVYSQLGVGLPHNAAMQYGVGVAVPRSALQPGDLVFFDGLGHVGIYVGNNAFIHAPHTGDVVRVSSLSGWYSSTYVGARRVG
jgi:cell wall-associated NlpC family hydrolase